MSTDSEQVDDGGEEEEELVPIQELKQMDRSIAEEELSDHDLERWEELQKLRESKEETAEKFEADDELAIDTLVQADMGELTTDLELYGNEVAVVIELNQDQQRLLRNVEDEYEDIDMEDPDDESIDAVEDVMRRFLQAVMVEFNGVDVKELKEVQKAALVGECVDKWGLRGTFHAIVEIVEATRDMDEERVGAIESFRPEERGRAGRGAPHDRP